MIVTFFSLKGGQGKTTIASAFAAKEGFGVITNDVYSPLERIFPANQFRKVMPDEDFPSVNNINVCYDLAGGFDNRSTKILKDSDIVVLPLVYNFLDFSVSINSIAELLSINKNVITIVNRVKIVTDFQYAKNALDKYFNALEIFKLKESRLFQLFFESAPPTRTLEEITNLNGLNRYQFTEPLKQFIDITLKIKEYER